MRIEQHKGRQKNDKQRKDLLYKLRIDMNVWDQIKRENANQILIINARYHYHFFVLFYLQCEYFVLRPNLLLHLYILNLIVSFTKLR